MTITLHWDEIGTKTPGSEREVLVTVAWGPKLGMGPNTLTKRAVTTASLMDDGWHLDLGLLQRTGKLDAKKDSCESMEILAWTDFPEAWGRG